MSQIKICPECSTEYFAHIDNCADCGEKLLFPEEQERLQEKKTRSLEKAFEDPVTVREGDLKWMSELRSVLMDAGVPSVINADTGCNKSCCNTCRLVVSSADIEIANELIEKYFETMHPEIKASNEMAGQGKCPACGSPVSSNADECPDCGLVLNYSE